MSINCFKQLRTVLLSMLLSGGVILSLSGCTSPPDVIREKPVDETPSNETKQFQLTINGFSGGTVTVNTQTCDAACNITLNESSPITISASAASGFRFESWMGDQCNATTSATCSFTLTQNVTITPGFIAENVVVYSINLTPSAHGTISDNNKINCGQLCNAGYPAGSQVSLTATPASGYRFSHWTGGACINETSANCQFVLNAEQAMEAHYVVYESQCTQNDILCVDDTNGAFQEYVNIQSAIDEAAAGDTVFVLDGEYAGFNLNKSGSAGNIIQVVAQSENVVINRRGTASDAIIRITNASYVKVSGFTVLNNDNTRYGLAARGATATAPMKQVTVHNNRVSNSPSTNIYLSQLANSLVEKNIAFNSAASHGIYLSNGGSDNTILRANTCYNNAKNGVHFNGDLSVGSSTDGLHTGIILEENILYDNVANGVDMDGVQSSIIRNNLIYGNGRHALRGFKIDSASGPKDLHIYNNTLADNNGWSIKLTDDEGGHIIFNNVLLDNDGSISVTDAGFASAHNTTRGIFRVNANPEAATIDLQAWQTLGYGASSSTASVGETFVNHTNHDYRLKSTSGAVNSGVTEFNTIQAPAYDISGRARPTGAAVDRGAYEQ